MERTLPGGSFVPNDTFLANDDAQLIILTGPNMAGKSTYLKQVALIVLLAQIGSFVPASVATIGLVDRIFTRIGAREDLASGRIRFLGYQPDIENWLAVADTVVVASIATEAQTHFDPLWGMVDPAAGVWFPAQALQLAQKANPPLF